MSLPTNTSLILPELATVAVRAPRTVTVPISLSRTLHPHTSAHSQGALFKLRPRLLAVVELHCRCICLQSGLCALTGPWTDVVGSSSPGWTPLDVCCSFVSSPDSGPQLLAHPSSCSSPAPVALQQEYHFSLSS